MAGGKLTVPDANAEARRLQRAVLAHGLDGHQVDGVPRQIGPAAWAELLAWAERERVVGLLASASSTSLALTELQEAELDRARLELIAVNLLLEGSVRRVADLLGETGIEWRILKGMATAQLVYPEPSLRTSGDVDLLVRPADLPRTLGALRSLAVSGGPPQHGAVRAGLQKAWQFADQRGVEIDVHQGIEGSLLTSRLPTDPLFARPQHVDVGGRSLLALATPAQLVHAVLHSTTPARLSTHADIARLARRCDPSDPLFAELLEPPRAQQLFVWALIRSADWVALPPEWGEYVRQHPLSGRAERWLDWVHDDLRHMRVANIVTGPRRTRRAIETLWPSDEFLRYFGLTRRQNFTRQLRRAPVPQPPLS